MGSKILTIDDSKTIRMIVARAFKSFDCEVFEASNGVEGLAAAATVTPDLIILDLTMPVMDGFETLTRLKADPKLKSIPVVMLTAESGRDNVVKIAKLGVRDYMVKPFKEELIVDRVRRIIELPLKGGSAGRKRFDAPLNVLVADDKPAIIEQIRNGLAATGWTVHGCAQASQALEFCAQTLPDIILASLTLPENSGFTLYQTLRANPVTKPIPIYALSVKTAAEEQSRAQQAGFNSIITKPIDFDEMKIKIIRTLNLDTTYQYFEHRNNVLLITLPRNLNSFVINEVVSNLRPKITEAVDSGLDRMVLDWSALQSADIGLIKLGLSAIEVCQELSLRHGLVGSEGVARDCQKYEETKSWRFASSFEEAAATLDDAPVSTA